MSDAAATPRRRSVDEDEPAGLAHRGRPSAIWLLILSGPLIWGVHFMVVYLLSELACRFALLESEVLGLRALSVVILVATVIGAVPTMLTTALAWRRWRNLVRSGAGEPPGEPADPATEGSPTTVTSITPDRDRSLAFVGILLGATFTLAILVVGLPALVLNPC